jgi:DNA-binding NarL/FixJ family response regulator
MSPTPGANPRRKVLIVDDHPIVRQGLAQAISRQPDLHVCAEADSAAQALEFLEDIAPDVALVDLSLKDVTGFQLIKSIRALRPAMPILVISMHEESRYAERALRAGAKGYIMKDSGIEEIVSAVRRVLEGRVYLSEELMPELLNKAFGPLGAEEASPVLLLSDREFEVFQLIGQGLTTRQIAERLRIGGKTVETYKAQIKKKLNLRSPVELHQQAFEWVQGGR